jgi:CubicO group peptidase (beta-lactamase class C family)
MHRTIKALAAAAALVLIVSARPAAQKPSAFSIGSVLPTLDAYLESLRLQAGIPGMSAAIVNEGSVIWAKGYGFANLATRERATPDTPYLVGDVSETLAAVLLLQCVEQRRIDLDAQFERYGLTEPETNATLRMLLSHTTPAAASEPFLFSPGRYAWLTPLMEWCAPQPYRKSVAHRLLDRLAMRDSVPGTDLADPNLKLPEGLFDSDDLDRYRRVLAKMAVPYKVLGRGKTERTEMPVLSMNAADGLVSTVRDLAEFDIALAPILAENADDAGRDGLLLPETLAAAWSPVATRTGASSPMGLGWFVQFYRDERVVWTFGNVPNAYSSLVLKLPARNTTFILLANSDGLSSSSQLPAGDVTRSPFATLFLKLTT